ncbi:MAG: murein biosynthesis integral membrane protein MurJ [Patescibacteria group bacterium]
MVKKLFRNGVDLFLKKQTTILSAAAIISATYLLSAGLGLARDRMMAERFLPSLLGIYWAADRIPSFIFNLVVIGALSSSFIPVFTRCLNRDGRRQSEEFASVIVNITLLVFAALSLLVVIFSSPLSKIMAPPGTSPADTHLLADLLSLLFLAQFFLLLSNFVTSVLQSFQRFLLPALSPLFYNLGIVLGILFLSGKFGIYAAAYGTIIGALLHLLIQLPLLPALNIRYRLSFNYRLAGVAEVWRLMGPRIFGIAASQISSLVDTLLSASISFASVTYFTFAQHLQNLPVSLFGAAIAQAALPILSVEAEKDDYSSFRKQFLTALYQMTFLLVPASVVILVLRLPAVRLAFGASLFDWTATVATGYVLAFFALSILAQAAVYLLARCFYALHDTATPVKISLVTVLVNVFFSLLFVKFYHFQVWSLGLSFSLSTCLNALLLVYFLGRKVGGFNLKKDVLPFIKIGLSGVAMALSIYLPLKILDKGAWGKYLNPLPFSLPENFDVLILDTRYTGNLIILTAVSAISGFLVYLVSAYWWRLPELNVFWELVGSSFRKIFSRVNSLLSRTGPINQIE